MMEVRACESQSRGALLEKLAQVTTDRGATEAEADTAEKLAQKLDSIGVAVTFHADNNPVWPPPKWCRQLATVVRDAFNIRAELSEPQLQ